jgi:RHS repeat-associated protein
LDYILTDEGVVKYSSIAYSYEFYLKDHLGNTRVMFKKSTGTAPELTQRTDYYAFGSLFTPVTPENGNNYRYNGKELQDDVLSSTAPDWYDYGARFYDPALARFHTLDPLMEDFYHQSPYVYADNNPIRFIDFMGMNASPYYDRNTGEYLGVDENDFEGQIKVTTKSAYNGAEKNKDGTVKSESIAKNRDTKDIQNVGMSAESIAKVYTDIVVKMDGVLKSDLYNGSISVFDNTFKNGSPGGYNEPEYIRGASEYDMSDGTYKVTMNAEATDYLNTVENAQNTLGAHELEGHGKMGLKTKDGNHSKVYEHQMQHSTWTNTTKYYRDYIRSN